jgi:hypothetical protein
MKCQSIAHVCLSFVLSTVSAGTVFAQDVKPCTYSIRSDSSWKPQQLVGVDPSGDIVGHSQRSNTGTCTFLVDTGAGRQVLKMYSPNGEIKELGQLARGSNGAGVVFTSLEGNPIAGNFAVPLSNGIVVLRESSAFLYEVGKPLTSIQMPPGWSPFPIQQGDVSGAQLLLVSKTIDAGGTFGIGGTKAASLLRVPDNKVRYGLLDLQQKSVVVEFETQGRSNNQYLMMSAAPKDDWPYKFNPLIRPQQMAGYLSSPADWFMVGDQRIVAHYDKGLTEIWLRNLSTGKSKLAAKNSLGLLYFYLPHRNGAYALISESSQHTADVAKTLETQE